jgi:type IV secretion system protein VirD4
MTLQLLVILAAVAVGLLLAHHITISKDAQMKHRAWAMRWRIWLRLRPGDGFAGLTELWLRWGRLAALGHGKRARPSMGFWARFTSPVTDYAVRFGRAQLSRRAFGRMQDQVLILAPPQSGKSGLLADRILDHPGPAVCTSTRTDLFDNTAGERHRRGPVHVFNPLGVGGVPSTFIWDMIAGCEYPDTAIRRAQDLTGDYETGDMKWWQSKASAALASLLHAAALAPWADMTTVYGWVQRWNDTEAEGVLASGDNASPVLRAIFEEIRRDGRTSDSVRATISECLTWVAIPELAAAVHPPPGMSFDVARFLATGGTLYMIAPGSEVAPIAPMFQAFVQEVHYRAGLIGSRMPAGKLDPPLLLGLDELTQICPLPLPSILADSAGKGVLVASVIHSIGQLETRWGKHGADTIWSTSGTKMFLPGDTDATTLERVSRLAGTVRADDAAVPVLPPELLRMLPKWRALVLTRNQRPVVVKTRPIWHRRNRWFWRPPVPPPVLTPAPSPVTLTPVAARPLSAQVPNGHPAS